MGREIRRVDKGWEHPRYTAENAKYPNWVGNFKPLFDEDYETAVAEWIKNHELWLKGEHEDQKGDSEVAKTCKYYADWGGHTSDPDMYRPKWKNPVCFQLYETVSEGTPVTPVFETKDELVNYLVNHGDDWSRKDGEGGWKREVAEAMVKEEWCPSFATEGGKVYTGPESLTIKSDGR